MGGGGPAEHCDAVPPRRKLGLDGTRALCARRPRGIAHDAAATASAGAVVCDEGALAGGSARAGLVRLRRLAVVQVRHSRLGRCLPGAPVVLLLQPPDPAVYLCSGRRIAIVTAGAGLLQNGAAAAATSYHVRRRTGGLAGCGVQHLPSMAELMCMRRRKGTRSRCSSI